MNPQLRCLPLGLLLACSIGVPAAGAQQQPAALELLHARKIWDHGPHNAFTDGTCYLLQRRDGRPGNTALLGTSKPPYTRWAWKDLGMYYGGPNFIQLRGGRWIAGGRLITPGTGAKTVICDLDVARGKLTPLVTLPSGGDTSYPGLLWHEDQLWVSYYSSHEGKTSIYLAVLRAE